MDEKPPFDPSLLFPIVIAGCSVVGILMILLTLRISSSRGSIQTIPTNTPLQFQYLGTEPGIAEPTEATPASEESPAITEEPTEFFLPPTATISFEETPLVLATNTLSTATLTVQPLGTIYDDADPTLFYTGNWIPQKDVFGVYNNTLHISSTIGNAIQLFFYGEKIRLTYQAGPSLGTVAIKLDTSDFTLNQAAADTSAGEWESPTQPLVNHTLTITHISGGSVNIDSLVIVDLSTPTPTATPTPTPTPTP